MRMWKRECARINHPGGRGQILDKNSTRRDHGAESANLFDRAVFAFRTELTATRNLTWVWRVVCDMVADLSKNLTKFDAREHVRLFDRRFEQTDRLFSKTSSRLQGSTKRRCAVKCDIWRSTGTAHPHY